MSAEFKVYTIHEMTLFGRCLAEMRGGTQTMTITPTYTVTSRTTGGERIEADDVPTLAAAKAEARQVFDAIRPMSVSVDGPDGQRVTASQRWGRGMLWRQ